MAKKPTVTTVSDMTLLELAVLRVVRELQLRLKSTNAEVLRVLAHADPALDVGKAKAQRCLMALCGRQLLDKDEKDLYRLTDAGKETLRYAAVFIR